MPRFFKETFDTSPFIEGEDANHIIKSLRMKIGEQLTVCDTLGNDYLCEIKEISDSRVDFNIIKIEKTISEPTVKVTLFQCMPKSDKMDSIVKQSVELGVTKIVPVVSSRCVSLPDEKSSDKKVMRWQKIANEAAGQSGRGILPEVSKVIKFNQMLDKLSEFDNVLFFYELGGIPISSTETKNGNCAIIIGPEGGFSLDEKLAAEKCGAVISTLGKRILRTETAPLAALSAIMTLTANME